MDANFGVRVALHPDGLARPLSSAGVGGSALAPDGQAAQMANAPVTFNALQALQIQAELAAQVALNDVFAILNGVDPSTGRAFLTIDRALPILPAAGVTLEF